MWEIAFALGALLLGIGLAYGAYHSRRRPKANEPITEQATREQYQNADGYTKEREQELRARAK